MITPKMALVLNVATIGSVLGGAVLVIWHYLKLRKKVNELSKKDQG